MPGGRQIPQRNSEAKNNAILKEHKQRIANQNKSNITNQGNVKTNPIEVLSPEKEQPKQTKQPNQPNQAEKLTEPIDIEKIKREIMLTTTQFILNKLGKENITKPEAKLRTF